MVTYFPCIHCGYLNSEKTIICRGCGKKIGEEKRIIAVKRKRLKINYLNSHPLILNQPKGIENC